MQQMQTSASSATYFDSVFPGPALFRRRAIRGQRP